MRDPKRIDVLLGVIAEIWRQYPDLRLMQLLNSVPDTVGFYTEDEKLLELLQKYGRTINQ